MGIKFRGWGAREAQNPEVPGAMALANRLTAVRLCWVKDFKGWTLTGAPRACISLSHSGVGRGESHREKGAAWWKGRKSFGVHEAASVSHVCEPGQVLYLSELPLCHLERG